MPKAPNLPEGAPSTPTVLYNGMIAPLIPYAIKGVVWYQGESNADHASDYQTLFPRMISDWREKWNEGDFPFIYVQLANYQAPQSKPSEGGSVSHGRRHCDHGSGHEAPDDARERPLHPRDDHRHGGPVEDLALVEEAMDPGDADVVDPLDSYAEHAQRFGALLGDRQITRSGAHERDRQLAEGGDRCLLERGDTGFGFVVELGKESAHLGGACGLEPRHEHVLPRPRELPRDPGDLLRGLPLAQYDLRRSLAESAVMIHHRVSEVGERKLLELMDRVIDAGLPRLHPIEELTQPCGIHGEPEPSTATAR